MGSSFDEPSTELVGDNKCASSCSTGLGRWRLWSRWGVLVYKHLLGHPLVLLTIPIPILEFQMLRTHLPGYFWHFDMNFFFGIALWRINSDLGSYVWLFGCLIVVVKSVLLTPSLSVPLVGRPYSVFNSMFNDKSSTMMHTMQSVRRLKHLHTADFWSVNLCPTPGTVHP